MMKQIFISVIASCLFRPVCAQSFKDSIVSFTTGGDVTVTFDFPKKLNKHHHTTIVCFALPNGNTTEQTMGKKLKEGDDWHYDIQHIRAQTKFVRHQWRKENVVVVYLENKYKSWPQWKTQHPDFKEAVQHIIEYVNNAVPLPHKSIYLNGHSGGGRFVFSYLDGVATIPSSIQRISFLDSDYGYDSTYTGKLVNWLTNNPKACLNVFAYNDSVVIYNGKPLVSPTGGTWYRSRLMLRDLSAHFTIKEVRNDSLIVYKSADERIQFFLKTNPEAKIFHTQQVELNGFIHSLFCGTRYDSRHYRYYTKRAYSTYIK